MSENVKRYTPDIKTGLTDSQIKERIERGEFNKESNLKSKPISLILRDNVCTIFNLVNFILAVAVFLVGSYKNMLFMVIIIINSLIGTFQEIRAKRTIDKLSIVNQQKIKAVRNGKECEIGINEIVLDEVFYLKQGQQVPTDCIIAQGSCEVNESLLTGESDAVFKEKDSRLISGSFLVSGSCVVIAEDRKSVV